MPSIPFHKYQGAGNDFILVDQRDQRFLSRQDTDAIRALCHRRFGIGADGLILLQKREAYDFEMLYFNADGGEGSMCGNGGRCIVAFASHLGIIGNSCRFLAVDGPHEARLRPNGWVELRLADVTTVEKGPAHFFLDTGSPHYVTFVDDLQSVDVFREGRAIRYSERFKSQGTNVNFVQALGEGIAVATYERGVEDETLACGTGVTASAIASYLRASASGPQTVPIQAKGGRLEARFEPRGDGFTNIWLCGPAEKVFEGTVAR
ncbi:MAG: diaminopimelate epimerase [Phaeodactylibacter sp.]|nr:diaminopimelate epimerase [Phaeodactylibacter sp.]MCB9276138.1 diaminopimelate epimerase [Lewinellaceae bacterium]